jgi:hypothetical protein
MFLSEIILHRLFDPEETTRFAEGAQKEAITVAAQLTGIILNEVVGRIYTF